MKKLILITIISLTSIVTYAQDNIIGVGCTNFSNLSLNYERIINSEFHLKLSFSRSVIDGNKSNKHITYDFSSLSAKIFSGEILSLDFYHGPAILVGYYYEYTNFNNNTTFYPYYEVNFDAVGNDDNNLPYYQNSSMISPQYNFGLERELGTGIFVSGELGLGAHFLFNDYMTILDKHNMGNFVPYVWFSLAVTYNYPNGILDF
tara:strand:+ start:786 stop:1397 length:612 start_codon:yes stop_codon:yes gene_type:complete